MQHSALCIISLPYVNLNWSYGPEHPSWVLTLVTLTFCMDITFVIGNNSWKFHDDSEKGVMDG